MEHLNTTCNIDWIDNSIMRLTPKKRLKVHAFLDENREALFNAVREHGAVLLRNFKLNNSNDFRAAVECLADNELLDYENRSTPRSLVSKKVYTSTEYPSEASIQSHNENSYSHVYPNFIYFFCLKNSEVGGQTPIVDNAKLFRELDTSVVELFKEKGIRYVRNYGDVDLSWQEVFNTDSKSQVECYCRANNIQYQWQGNKLRTEAIRPAVRQHEISNQPIWFNQAHLFHYSNLGDTAQDLLNIYGLDGLPRNATFGDGSAIPIDILEHIREKIMAQEIVFDWQPSDLLIVDNLRMAHGRKPFEGNRKVLVIMSHAKSA